MATVLIVDDDADVLATLAAIVRSSGHTVVKASSAAMALDILDADQPFDLMITDIVMPGVDGFNLARMASRHRPALRILYITGYHEAVAAMHDTGERFGKMLTKPLLPAELRREVDEALATRPM